VSPLLRVSTTTCLHYYVSPLLRVSTTTCLHYHVSPPCPGTATTTIPAVQTAVPNNDLVHGCVYTVGIEYRDRAPNDPVLVNRVGIHYDILTETPSITAPESNAILVAGFDVVYVLPEQASPLTVTLTFTRVGGLADVGSPHVVVLTDVLPGTYTRTMTDFSTAVSAHPYIDALTSDGGAASALTDGATYDVDLHYSDNIGNAASTTVSRTGLFFAGSSTLPPTFARPAENARLPQQFVIDFTLPEPAHPGTLTMTFTPQNTGATDANGPRVITFDSRYVVDRSCCTGSSLSCVGVIFECVESLLWLGVLGGLVFLFMF
jgi:hypothetical protein